MKQKEWQNDEKVVIVLQSNVFEVLQMKGLVDIGCSKYLQKNYDI